MVKERIQVLFNPKDLELVKKVAEEKGLSLSSYIRSLTLKSIKKGE